MKIKLHIIAATNRDLRKEVQDEIFRSDLFYRLNVFPIVVMPLLRHRLEDIPLLLEYFIKKLLRNTDKTLKSATPKVVQEIMEYSWRGNICKLEHIIERSELLSTGTNLKNVYLPSDKKPNRLAEK